MTFAGKLRSRGECSMSQSLCCVPGKARMALHPRICCRSRTLSVGKSLAAQTCGWSRSALQGRTQKDLCRCHLLPCGNGIFSFYNQGKKACNYIIIKYICKYLRRKFLPLRRRGAQSQDSHCQPPPCTGQCVIAPGNKKVEQVTSNQSFHTAVTLP